MRIGLALLLTLASVSLVACTDEVGPTVEGALRQADVDAPKLEAPSLSPDGGALPDVGDLAPAKNEVEHWGDPHVDQKDGI